MCGYRSVPTEALVNLPTIKILDSTGLLPETEERGTIHLDKNVAVQNGETGGHVCRYLDIVLLQLLIHAEQQVMCRPVAACNDQQQYCSCGFT